MSARAVHCTVFSRQMLRSAALLIFGLPVLLIALLTAALAAGSAQRYTGQLIFWTRGDRGFALDALDPSHGVRTRLVSPPPHLVVDLPRLSGTGQRAAFELSRAGQLAVAVRDSFQRTLYLTTEQTDIEDRLPALSPDGRHLAYWTSRRNANLNARFQNWHFMLLDTDTGETRRIIQDQAIIPYNTPIWSPDGRRIAVQYWAAGRDAGTFIVDAVSGESFSIRQFVDTPGGLAWSPDGEQIVFRSTRDGNPDLFLYTIATASLTNLTRHPATEFDAAWSPDARYLAFVTTRDGRGEIYLMRLSDQQMTRLTYGGGWSPSWSPDGRHIAFISRRGGADALYLVEASGGEPRFVDRLHEGNRFIGWYVSGALISPQEADI